MVLGFLVAANKKHPQQVVLHLLREESSEPFSPVSHCFLGVLLQQATPACSLAQVSDDIVVRHAKQPSRGIVRRARNGPRLECGHQGGLNGVLNNLDVRAPTRDRAWLPAARTHAGRVFN